MIEPSKTTSRHPVPPLVHVLGWYGCAAILAMYLLNSFEHIDDQAVPYQLFNATGAVGLGLICWWRRAWPALWLEVVWAAVAIGALVRIVF